MTDLTLTHERELNLTQVEGNTDAGVEFVDAYTALECYVVDSGRIIVSISGSEALEIRAREAGLTVQHEEVR